MWGKFCNLSYSDLTWKPGSLDTTGELGGEAYLAIGWPSKLRGGTRSIRFARWGPHSGLYKSGLEGKLPVNNGEVTGVGNVLAGLEKTGERLITARRIPFCVQNASRDRAWFEVLTESALYEASTRRTVRLQPNVGPASFNPSSYKKKR
jgi:hypothetical protein